MIQCSHVSKHYGAKEALKDINLTIGKGEFIGLFGENGAGKTTLMKSILTFLPHKGEVTLDGEPITRKNIHRISFATCEHSFFPALNAKGHKEFYREHFDGFNEKRFDGLMEFFSLPDKTPIRRLSTGQKNQFEVILALCQGADFIFMDEPFAGNDIFNREDFYKVLMGILEPHETVILSTHLIEEVSDYITRAVLLHQGQVAADVSAEVLEEQGISLVDYVKQTYRYQSDRVSKALDQISGKDEDDA